MGQAPVRWERQLVSRCCQIEIMQTVLAELEQQQHLYPYPYSVAVPEPTTEFYTHFHPQLRNSTAQLN
ncbi:hypothetical protein CVS40_7433 [Lucilia cuprina]|nr:hypothetical protein CVS40_7433 [Lucilia cuprina]